MKRGDIVTVQRLKGYLSGMTPVYQRFAAKVIAVADGWAMCRRPHCIPFVDRVKSLEAWTASNPPETITKETTHDPRRD